MRLKASEKPDIMFRPTGLDFRGHEMATETLSLRDIDQAHENTFQLNLDLFENKAPIKMRIEAQRFFSIRDIDQIHGNAFLLKIDLVTNISN